LLLSLVLGTILTTATLLVNRKSSFEGCEGLGLHQVQKGLPLPLILVRPSMSICNSVEPISILWKGNAYHEQYATNAIVDIVVWSAISASGILGLTKWREPKKR